MELGLKGRTVIVTGAASGIGKATAQAYAKEGANLALADINYDGLKALKDELKDTKVYIEKVDVTDAKSCETFVDNVHKEYGRIDVLVNNAGTAKIADLATFP